MKIKEQSLHKSLYKYCLEQLSEISECPEAEVCFILEELESSEDQMARLEEILTARKKHEPLQYILESWKFRYLDLYLNSSVLIPRPETEITVQVALDCLNDVKSQVQNRQWEILDLGCGSGAIGLSILKEAQAELKIVCTDVSERALEVARINLKRNFDEGHYISQIDFRHSDWFSALEENEMFHLIVSNPPYISDAESLPPEVELYEPKLALRSGVTGFEDISHIIHNAKDWLFESGWLVVELAPDQATQAVELAESLGYKNSASKKDLTGKNRILLAQK